MTAFCIALVKCSIPIVFNCCIRVYGTNPVADRITGRICIFFTLYLVLIRCIYFSYPMGTRGSFPGVKAAGLEANHSTQSNSEVKNAWSYTTTPGRLHGVVLS
jgi:hypothetical protein